MNIRQLQYITSVARNGLSVSATADSLYTSQPGVSKQIRQLEDELGVQIFERRGRQLTRVTAAGQAVIARAERALVELESIARAAREFSEPGVGGMSVALTHAVARYAFPPVVDAFRRDYPQVRLHLHLATPSLIAHQVNTGQVDFGIATEVMAHFEDLVALPCYRWRRAVLVPAGHPLADAERLDLDALARWPLATYTFGFDRGSPLELAFRERGLTPEVRFTATDADVIKTYVRLGLGAGIVAALAYDAAVDADLRCLDASHLFEVSTAYLVFRRGAFFRGYLFDFLQRFAPHLDEATVRAALASKGGEPGPQIDGDALPLF